MNTSCYTYFAIKGDFSPDELTNKLNLVPTNKWAIGDLRKNGKSQYDFALWEYGKCEEYDMYVENQCLKTTSALKNKVEELKSIKATYDVSFTFRNSSFNNCRRNASRNQLQSGNH